MGSTRVFGGILTLAVQVVLLFSSLYAYRISIIEITSKINKLQ